MICNSTLRRMTPGVLALILSSCAVAPWQKAGVPGATPEERVHNAQSSQQAQPEAIAPRRDTHVTREKATYELLLDAEKALREDRKEDATALYARVLSMDPVNARALAGQRALKREQQHQKQLSEARTAFAKGQVDTARAKVHQILLEQPDHAGALALQEEIRIKQAGAVRHEPPRLKPPFDKPVTLELRDANIKMVFEALTRTTGINFILDKDIKPDTKATVYIKKARIEDAIEMVLATNGLQKKVLSETNALVFPNTTQKLKDYQDLMIRSFYLTNAKAKDVAAMLKTMLKTKDLHVDERLNMIVLRDTPEVVRVAEKLVASNDMADPEVMLEMEVLEISRSRLQELGITYPTQLAVVGATATATSMSIEALRNVTSNNINVSPLPAINFKKTAGDVNLLANPRIRVRNNDKAKVQVGDKVPVITTTATAGVGSSETVQYVDVGLKLEVEPRITLDSYVNIKVALEVSSLGEKTKLTNGSTVYQIGTRNASTLLRLKDGETQVLAGLISDDERKSANRLPGLGDIPLLGRLFSNQTDSRNKTEIVLAITPRVLSNIQRPEAEVSEYWSGTENTISDKPQIVVPAGGGASPASSARELIRRPGQVVPARPAETPAEVSPAAPADTTPQAAAEPASSVATPAAPEPQGAPVTAE